MGSALILTIGLILVYYLSTLLKKRACILIVILIAIMIGIAEWTLFTNTFKVIVFLINLAITSLLLCVLHVKTIRNTAKLRILRWANMVKQSGAVVLYFFSIAILITLISTTHINSNKVNHPSYNITIGCNNNLKLSFCFEKDITNYTCPTAPKNCYLGKSSESVFTLMATVITILIAYLSYKINKTVRNIHVVDIFDKVYENIIKNAKEAIEKAKHELHEVEERKHYETYLTYMNRLGYYIYKGLLPPEYIQEQFSGRVWEDYKVIYKYLKEKYDKNTKQVKFSKRFYFIPLMLSLEYLYDQGIITAEDIKNLKINKNWLYEDVQSWIEVYLPQYKKFVKT